MKESSEGVPWARHCAQYLNCLTASEKPPLQAEGTVMPILQMGKSSLREKQLPQDCVESNGSYPKEVLLE